METNLEESKAKIVSDTDQAVNALNGRIDFTNKDLAATLKNTGQHAAICTVEVPEELKGFLSCSHSTFRLAPGATQPMTVMLKPRSPRTLDGATLICSIRGCKGPKLALAGSAIVPDVRIIAPPPEGDAESGEAQDT